VGLPLRFLEQPRVEHRGDDAEQQRRRPAEPGQQQPPRSRRYCQDGGNRHQGPDQDAGQRREAQQVHGGLHRPRVEQGREEQGQQELRVHPHRRQAGQEGAAEAGAGQQEDLRQARQLRQRQQRPDRGEDERDELQFAHGAAARSTGVSPPSARRISTGPDAGGAGTVRTGSRPSVLRPLRARQRLAIGA